jgi:hypothetical protein
MWIWRFLGFSATDLGWAGGAGGEAGCVDVRASAGVGAFVGLGSDDLADRGAAGGAGVHGVAGGGAEQQCAARNEEPPLGRSLPPGRARRPYRWGYQAQWAQRRADAARRRPTTAKLAVGTGLRQVVAGKLARRWSPKQIAAWLRATFVDRPELQVSHETIYQAIYVQSRGNLRAELTRQVTLRSGRTARRPQSRARAPPAAAGPGSGTCTSAPDRPRPPTGRCPGTGKVTWSSARPAPQRS